MKKFLHLVSLCTATAGGVVVVLLQKPAGAFFSGELSGHADAATAEQVAFVISGLVLTVIVCGFLIGLLHGWTFGTKSASQLAMVAMVPLFLYWLFLVFATYFLAMPAGIVVAAFGWLVAVGVRSGAKLPGACQSR